MGLVAVHHSPERLAHLREQVGIAVRERSLLVGQFAPIGLKKLDSALDSDRAGLTMTVAADRSELRARRCRGGADTADRCGMTTP